MYDIQFCDFCELTVLLLFFASLFHKMFCFVYLFMYTLQPYLPLRYLLNTQLYFNLIREHILGLNKFLIVYYNKNITLFCT